MTTPPRLLSLLSPGHLVAVIVFSLLVTALGCSRSPAERAFAGKFSPEQNNKIITGYCTSCHSHKDFQAEPHVAQASTWYDKRPYQGATECRTCHLAKLKGWAISWVKRTTRRPHGRLTPPAERLTPPPPAAPK